MGKTISYSKEVKGWTSFHSYVPEWMENLGAEFFSFKNGNLYKHDSNQNRTEFYGVSYGCSVTYSSNKGPSDVKVYKALKLETNSDSWYASLQSELESGEIGSASNLKFVNKEGMQYGYVRRVSTDTLNFNELSIHGLGTVTNIAGNIITISAVVPNQISANNTDGVGGDSLYFGNGTLAGIIDSFGGNSITLSAIVNTPNIGDFVFAAKNPQSESYGLRGFHSKVTLKNDSTNFVELFAGNAEVFKSFM
jgi:hypothetical protein